MIGVALVLFYTWMLVYVEGGVISWFGLYLSFGVMYLQAFSNYLVWYSTRDEHFFLFIAGWPYYLVTGAHYKGKKRYDLFMRSQKEKKRWDLKDWF